MVASLKKKCLVMILLCLLIVELTGAVFAIGLDTENSVFYFSKEKGIHTLDGEWDFYHQQFLIPSDFLDGQYINQSERVLLPGDLTKQQDRNGIKYESDTYGTLKTIVIIDDLSAEYGLKIPYLSSANSLWINGHLVFSSGVVADQKKDFIPQYLPAEIYFSSDQKEIEIVAQIANFHHRRIRMNDVYFGAAGDIKQLSAKRMIKESALAGGLFLVSIYYAILFYIKKTDRASLYLALLSFLVATRGLILQEKIVLRLFPDLPGEILMKLGFLPVFLFLPLVSLYIEDVFKINEIFRINQILKKASVFFVGLVLIMPGKIYDFAFDISKNVFILLAIYLIFILFSKKYHQSRGFVFMMAGSIVLFITAVNDILREFDWVSTPEMFSYGIFIFIIIQAIFLAWKYNDVHLQSMSLSKEIDTLNKDLEQIITKRTRELEKANKELLRMSRTDSLTGLFNRRYFDIKFMEEWRRCTKEQIALAIIMIDIDHFKEYNDHNGHMQGDNTLLLVALEIKKSIRKDKNFAARYGGEEFIVLLPGADIQIAFQVAESIRGNIEKLCLPHPGVGNNPYVTVSIGICSELPKKDKTRTDVINAADIALYKAKNSGRNRVILCEK